MIYALRLLYSETNTSQCTGVVPCGNCIKSRIECTLDHTADKRRRGALKRKIDQLEEKEDLLIRLVEVLRESGNSRTGPLINLIRSNASLAEIRYYLDHELPQSELAQTPALAEVCGEVERVQKSESRSIRRILDAKRLSDIPRFQVPARPWTTVVEDNDFVSHLVSLWFTWCHPFSNWIDRDRFVKDMQAGSLDARYCSPFLVNIILAEACVCILQGVAVLRVGLIIADIFRLSRSICCSWRRLLERSPLLRRSQASPRQGGGPHHSSHGAGVGDLTGVVSFSPPTFIP